MPESTFVNCTVLKVKPVRKGRLIALARVEIDIEGVVVVIEGVRVFKYRAPGNAQEFAGVQAPQFRNEQGVWQEAVILPPEVEAVFSDTVMQRCNELGITSVKRTVAEFGDGSPQSLWLPK